MVGAFSFLRWYVRVDETRLRIRMTYFCWRCSSLASHWQVTHFLSCAVCSASQEVNLQLQCFSVITLSCCKQDSSALHQSAARLHAPTPADIRSRGRAQAELERRRVTASLTRSSFVCLEHAEGAPHSLCLTMAATRAPDDPFRDPALAPPPPSTTTTTSLQADAARAVPDTLAVGRDASLTLGTDSLVVLGVCRHGASCAGMLRMRR